MLVQLLIMTWQITRRITSTGGNYFAYFHLEVYLLLSQDWSNRKSRDEGGEFHVHHQVRGGYLEDDGDS